MEKDIASRRRASSSSSGACVTRILALLLIVCLVECATEQRINSRGSKSSNLVEKVNGWRSQRGGSCLSYGHSCWGAHGKRSGKPPVTAPDWYLTRMLRRIAANNELRRADQEAVKIDDINAIYQTELADASSKNNFSNDNENAPVDLALSRNPEAIPMLDDDLLSKMKIWQLMNEGSEKK